MEIMSALGYTNMLMQAPSGITLVASNYANNMGTWSGTSSTSKLINTTNANFICVITSEYSGSVPTTRDVSDNYGNTYTKTQDNNDGNNIILTTWTCANANTGPNFQVNYRSNVNPSRPVMTVLAYSGVNSSPIETSRGSGIGSNNNTGLTTIQITPTVNKSLMITAFAWQPSIALPSVDPSPWTSSDILFRLNYGLSTWGGLGTPGQAVATRILSPTQVLNTRWGGGGTWNQACANIVSVKPK